MTAIASLLVIDDDPSVLQTLQRVAKFSQIGHVAVCGSAGEAETELEKNTFDMIVCDYRLLADNGVKFIAKMRERGVGTPVLFISGAPDTQGVLEATQMGRTDFLAKPFSLSDFRERVGRLAGAQAP